MCPLQKVFVQQQLNDVQFTLQNDNDGSNLHIHGAGTSKPSAFLLDNAFIFC